MSMGMDEYHEIQRNSNAARVAYFNREDFLHQWKVGDLVWCLHCHDKCFKAEDIAFDDQGRVECPLCRSGSVPDFSREPWDESLVVKVPADSPSGYSFTFKVPPVPSVPLHPRQLVPRVRTDR
jgi:hypothetical protein